MKATTVLLAFLAAAAAPAGPLKLSSPYAVMQRHYEAVGGLERCRAETTAYYESDLVIEGAGLSGKVREWRRTPDRYRQEVDLGILRQTAGDNGVFGWEVDPNGRLQVKADQRSLEERRLAVALARYEQLDSNSTLFRLTLAAPETVGGADCYVVRRTNTINRDTAFDYIRRADFMLVRTAEVRPDMKQVINYADFREVNGVKRPFEQRVEILPVGQRQTIRLTSYVANEPIEESRFEPPAATASDFRFTRGASAVSIPFQFIENHIYLPVTVDGRQRLWVLDCGAGRSVVDIDYAQELGLELAGGLTAQGAAGTTGYSFATLPGFSLPGIEFGAQQVIALSISPLFRRLVGTDVAGILGYDFLSRFVTRIDYAGKRVSFYLPDSFRYAGRGETLAAPLANNMPTMEATVDGRYAGRWRLDIGATASSFHYPFARDHGLLDRDGPVVTATGAGGGIDVRQVRFDSIALGRYTVSRPLMSVPLASGKGALSSAELVGNLGNDVLRRFVLYLDYARHRVILEPGKDFRRDFPHDRSGLGLMISDSGAVTVAYAAAGTPAADAGLEPGDVILTANGRPVGLESLRRSLRQRPGTKYVLGIERGDACQSLTITLRDIY